MHTLYDSAVWHCLGTLHTTAPYGTTHVLRCQLCGSYFDQWGNSLLSTGTEPTLVPLSTSASIVRKQYLRDLDLSQTALLAADQEVQQLTAGISEFTKQLWR